VIETTSVEEALNRLGDENTVFIDLRDAPELERDKYKTVKKSPTKLNGGNHGTNSRNQ
jgi:hypothetical protein